MLSAIAFTVLTAQAQSPRTSTAPLPAGQRAVLKDGDVIYVERGARVKVVTRSEGIVHAIYNAEQHWLVLLIDYAPANGGQPDGFVDYSYSFNDLQGEWPLGPRWEGSAAIEEVTLAGQGGRLSVNLRTQSGLYQIASGPLNPNAPDVAFDPSSLARVSHRSGSSGSVGRDLTFDAAEAREVERATMRASGTIDRTVVLPNGGTATTRTSLTVVGPDVKSPMAPTPANASGLQPVRVGSGIRAPQKIVDAQPVYPPIAQSARVQGVVILEITVGTDGSVTDATILRSIPLLDQAALDCVKQWKYEPTQLNGAPVPVIMTVTVNFALQDAPPVSPPSNSR